MNHEPFEFDDVHDLLDEGDDDPSLTIAAEWAFHLGNIIGSKVQMGLQAARDAGVPRDYAVQGAVDSLLRIAASLYQAGINTGRPARGGSSSANGPQKPWS